jgi:hypothetical protein
MGLVLSGLTVLRAQGPAAEAGIQQGDRIVMALGRSVASGSQFRSVISEYCRTSPASVNGVRIPITLVTPRSEEMLTVFLAVAKPSTPLRR